MVFSRVSWCSSFATARSTAAELIGRRDLRPHVMAVPFERHLAHLPSGDAPVALLTEVHVRALHAVEKTIEATDLVGDRRPQGGRHVGVATAHGDVHGPLLAVPGGPSVRGV